MTVTLTIDDIKSKIEVIFKQRVANLIKVGTKGKVLFCVKNEDLETSSRLRVFTSAVFNLDSEEITLEKQIKQIFNGGAVEVNVLEYKTTFSSVTEQIDVLKWD